MYEAGLTLAEAARDVQQTYYHSINLAFLHLVSRPAGSRIPEEVQRFAELALRSCTNARQDHWSLATEGDAYLMLGKDEEALKSYSRAIQLAKSPRDLDSMYQQAVLVAVSLRGQELAERVQEVFGVSRST